jgi:hypothetical protein
MLENKSFSVFPWWLLLLLLLLLGILFLLLRLGILLLQLLLLLLLLGVLLLLLLLLLLHWMYMVYMTCQIMLPVIGFFTQMTHKRHCDMSSPSDRLFTLVLRVLFKTFVTREIIKQIIVRGPQPPHLHLFQNTSHTFFLNSPYKILKRYNG